MHKQDERGEAACRPGVWSTDDYIRAWSVKQGLGEGECIVALQSLHDSWVARIRFDAPGHPVERYMERRAVVADESAAELLPVG